jgi:ferredoxin
MRAALALALICAACGGILDEDEGSSNPLLDQVTPPTCAEPTAGGDGHHRAGEDCLGCHRQGGDGTPFSVAGTLYADTGGTAPAAGVAIHVLDINDDRCTGCDACVAVCPTNVLDLVGNKSRVLRFHDCIQCEACMWACPTEALVMFPEGTEPQPLKVPELDDAYQTGVPGQYLIGEVAGKPLVKNAANLGRAVVEHMLRTGLRAGSLAAAASTW